VRQRAVQLLGGLAAVAAVLALYGLSERERERRHSKRPQAVVDRLIDVAHLSASDTLYDLECGDGSVVVSAAKRYGAHAWCFDIYPQRLAEARERARQAGVEPFVTFQLTREPRPGARIVSYRLNMGDWEPRVAVTIPAPAGEPAGSVQLWIADGTFRPLLE
jgi:hypothetical protein